MIPKYVMMNIRFLIYTLFLQFVLINEIYSQKFDFNIEVENLWSSSVYNTNDQPFARSSRANLDIGYTIGYTVQNKYRISLGRRNHNWYTAIPQTELNSGSAAYYLSSYYHINIGKKFSYNSLFIYTDMGLVYRNMDVNHFVRDGPGGGYDYILNTVNIGLKPSLTLGYDLPYNLQVIGSIDYHLFRGTPKSIVGFHFGFGFKI